MIFNGSIKTTQTAIYTTRPDTNGVEVTMIRVVNESGADRTFTVFLNVSGTAHAVTPVDTQLPIGACFDDFPVFQLPPNGIIEAVADGEGVSWTINAINLSAIQVNQQ